MPSIVTATSLWFGGQRLGLDGLAKLQTGGSFESWMVMVTKSGRLESCPSSTTSWNTMVAPPGPTNGAVKLGVAAVGFMRVTAGPDTCVQLNASDSLSGSLDAEPSRLTAEPSLRVWSGPAFAIGG